MFEWLLHELARVKTPKFHRVDGLLPAGTRELVEASEFTISPSYKTFVRQFGNARLYRIGSQYRIEVFALPIASRTERGEPRLCFGRTEDTAAYFKESSLIAGEESSVFEWHYEDETERQTANGFEEWLREKCITAKRRYTNEEWRQIEEGPPPFSDREKRVVEARRKFRWRVLGVSSSGDIKFEVHNGSDMILPFLSVGIRGQRRGTDAALEGGVWLPVGSVLPGQTTVIEKGCYREWVDPQDVVVEKPDPGPEDRDRYWEFKPLPK